MKIYGFVKGTSLIDAFDKRLGTIVTIGEFKQSLALKTLQLSRNITVDINGEVMTGREVVIPKAKIRYAVVQ